MKVVLPTADYPPIEGGISTVTLHVARELVELGHDVTVVAPFFPDMEAFDANEPYEVIRYKGYALGPARLLPMAVSTWHNLRKADLVLPINIASGGLLAWLSKRLGGPPYVCFAYAYEFMKFHPRGLVASLLRHIYHRSLTTVAISAYTRDELLRFGLAPGAITVIHPGASIPDPPNADSLKEVRSRYALDDASPMILAVGRFVARKGFRTLVRALPRVLARYPQAVALMAGRGPDISPVAKLAWRLNVRNHVILPGRVHQPDLDVLYSLCDLFALPTGETPGGQVEGFGLVFTEAHARGKPVIAGRSGGAADAVLDGETGFLVPPDDPDALADAILRLLDDKTLAHQLASNGKERVAHELNWAVFTRCLVDEAVRRAPHLACLAGPLDDEESRP